MNLKEKSEHLFELSKTQFLKIFKEMYVKPWSFVNICTKYQDKCGIILKSFFFMPLCRN